MTLPDIARDLCRRVDRLRFAEPVAYVYNPLSYAWEPHCHYLERWGQGEREVVFLGMNPGPFGMVQTGVPFGDVAMARDFLGIEGEVGHPPREHPKRPVLGFACSRSEVSGSRFWGWVRDRFGTAERFFERFFVINYCPLAFLEASGRNRTPDKLPAAERDALFVACDRALRADIELLRPERVVGVGVFARDAATRALAGMDVKVGCVLHPSPASPKANNGWARLAEEELAACGIRL